MFKRRSKSGQPVYRHTTAQPATQSTGDEPLRAAIVEHIESHLGPIIWTWQDPSPQYVRVDVHIVGPGENSPGLTLVTSGMSEQHAGSPRRQHTELVMGVRPNWPGIAGDAADEEHLWPVRLLRDLARLPHQYDTHLGMHHTVPNGDPATPYASDTTLCGALLSPPLVTPDAFNTFIVGTDKIEMLGVIPLHADEMQYKLDHGADSLWMLLDEHEISEALNPWRPSTIPA